MGCAELKQFVKKLSQLRAGVQLMPCGGRFLQGRLECRHFGHSWHDQRFLIPAQFPPIGHMATGAPHQRGVAFHPPTGWQGVQDAAGCAQVGTRCRRLLHCLCSVFNPVTAQLLGFRVKHFQ